MKYGNYSLLKYGLENLLMNKVNILKEIICNELKKEDHQNRIFSNYFYIYNKSLLNKGFDELLLFMKYVMNSINGYNKKILDVGCGFGIKSILFCILGAKELHACDINIDEIADFRKLLKLVKISNLYIGIEDACYLPYKNECFDICFVHGVLSHIHNQELTLSEIYRVLKHNGTLFLFDENNSLYFPFRYRRRKFWKRCEYGPTDPTSNLFTPYIKMREEIIKENFPHIEKEILKNLAKKTQGLIKNEIIKAVPILLNGKRIKKPKFKYRNPLTGEYPEREINPLRLKKQLEKYGFKIKITKFFYPPYRGVKGIAKRLIIPILKEFSYPLVFMYHFFIMIGKKK